MKATVAGWLAVAATFGSAAAAAAETGPANRLAIVSFESVDDGYVEVEGMLSGRFTRRDGSTGGYEAPVHLLYPRDPARCGGLAVEELANAAFFNFPLLRDERWNLRFAGLMLGDAFLRARRVVYAAATWDKKAVDQMGKGRIERREDGRRIVEDVAALLRDPASVQVVDAPAGFVAPACPAETLVGYGFSDAASLLRSYMVEGDTGGHFDAALLHAAGSTCWDFTVGQASDVCPRLPAGLDAKVISLDAETEVQIQGGAGARQEHPSYRHYEIAGAAHLPKQEIDLMELAGRAADEDPVFATALRATSRFQNPEAMAPATRAAFHHLVEWTVHGTAPPGNAHLDGSFDALGRYEIARDSDGNALGGVRLPWLETVLPDGSRVGAPLGAHDGVDAAGGFVLGGRYECFADLRARYPTNLTYRSRVASGARHAESKGWILGEDRRAYMRRAAEVDIADPDCPPWHTAFEPTGEVPIPAGA